MAALPDGLTLARNRDLPLRRQLLTRWIFVGTLLVLSALALLNVFGQSPETSRAAVPQGELEVYAPTKVRGGLFYQGRFTIRAREEIASATLVLDGGWTESMHINTLEPAPVGEASRDGRLTLDFGRVAPGKHITVYMQFQVNPTNIGRRSQDVTLTDGERVLAHVDRTVTIFP